MDRSYVAFISYRHAPLDSAAAKTVHSLIERYRIPRSMRRFGQKQFGYVFRDREELPVSSDLSEDIRSALDASENLIVICTPETAKSPWVSREIACFLERHDRKHIFAVLAAGEPAKVFPTLLTQVPNPDGTFTETEPLALDIRADGIAAMNRKLRREIFRLYAALIGCPYDALIQRHQRRRLRITAAAAAAVLTVAMAFSGVLLVKNHQISMKNQELAQQKAQVQLRESELLIESSRDAYEQGDYAAAAQYALAALPQEDDPRPYHAEAEQTLIDALGIFDDRRAPYVLTKTEVKLSAPAEDFFVLADGSRLAVIDRYNVVTCHDTGTGAQQWSIQLDTGDTYRPRLLYGSENSFLGICGNGITAIDSGSGEILWHYASTNLTGQRPVLSEDRALLALMERKLSEDRRKYEFELVILSVKTGAEICRTRLAEGMTVSPTEEVPYVVLQEIPGTFSADSGRFAGCFTEQSHTGAGEDRYFVLDIGTATIQTVCALSEPDPYSQTMIHLYWSGEDQITAVYRRVNGNSAVTVRSVDFQRGLLWETATPEESSGFADFDPVCCVHTDRALYITRGSHMYVLRSADGSLTQTGTLGGSIISLKIVEDRYFGLLTEEGSYTLGWKNENGFFYSEETFGTALTVGGIEKAALWGDSLLRAVSDGEKLTGVEAVENGSILAAVSENEPNLVAIYRILCPADISETTQAAIPEFDNRLWLTDNVAFLTWEAGGDITLVDSRGETTILSQNESVTLPQQGNVTFTYSKKQNSAVRLASDDSILAASCDGENLWLWRDGKLVAELPLPEDLTWSVLTNVQAHRFLLVTGSGHVLLSHFDDAQDLIPDGIAVYDLYAGKWQRMTCYGTAPMAAAQEKPLLAALDDGNILHIWDFVSGKELCTAQPGIPQNSVMQAEFVLRDRYLLLKLKDQQVLLIDAATAKTVFSRRIQGTALGTVHCFEDKVNRRVYLTDDSALTDAGLCLDMGSWTVLAEIPGFAYYDSEADCIYRQTSSGEAVRCRLPGTGELVEFTRKTFGLP